MNGIPLRPSIDALHERAMSSLVRACIATAHAKLNPGASTRNFITAQWGAEGQRDVDMVLKAASSPATTSTPAWAGVLSSIAYAYLSNLVGYSAGAALLDRGVKLSSDNAGQINVPGLTMPLGDFVAQGQMIPVVSGVSNLQASLTPSKLAIITVLSNEMISTSNAETLVRTALLESMAVSLDRRLFDNAAAVPDLRPAGLLHNVVPLTPTPSTGGIYEAMVTDLRNLANAVAPKAGNLGISIVASPSQAIGVALGLVQGAPWPLLTSSSLPSGTVIAVANAALISAFGDPLIDSTRAASLSMTDAPGGGLIGGGSVSAMFQNDCTGLRLRWPISWALRDPGAIAAITAAAW